MFRFLFVFFWSVKINLFVYFEWRPPLPPPTKQDFIVLYFLSNIYFLWKRNQFADLMSMYIVFCILYLYVLNYIMVSIQRRIRKKAKHDRVAQKTSLTDPSHRLISTYFIEMRYFRLLFKNSILNLFTWIEKRLKCSGPSIVLTWDDWFEGSESFSNVHSGYKILEILKLSSYFFSLVW